MCMCLGGCIAMKRDSMCTFLSLNVASICKIQVQETGGN